MSSKKNEEQTGKNIVKLNLPSDVLATVREFVKAGFFKSENELLLAAIAQFVRRNRIELAEQFAREDIEWAKKEAKKAQ